jgi:hypothetical protein
MATKQHHSGTRTADALYWDVGRHFRIRYAGKGISALTEHITAISHEEPFTLNDGVVVFHHDGSTSLRIKIPAGTGGTGQAQEQRFVTRLLELAIGWVAAPE